LGEIELDEPLDEEESFLVKEFENLPIGFHWRGVGVIDARLI